VNNDPKNNKLMPSQPELETLLQYFHNKQYDLAEKTALILSKNFQITLSPGQFLGQFLIKLIN